MFILSAVLFFVAGSAQAATLNVVGGQLMGASGVNVGGTSYDVSFLEGSCISLYNGCDVALDDFTFNTESGAQAAAQALLDQVFLDTILGDFDSVSSLTFGCPNSAGNLPCYAGIPYGVDPFFGDVFTYSAVNSDSVDQPNDYTTSGGTGQDGDFTLYLSSVYVVFSTPAIIPEPSTALLLGLGLTGLAGKGRRRNRS
jgi:hypothetical protein